MRFITAIWGWVLAVIARVFGKAKPPAKAHSFSGVTWLDSGSDPARELAARQLVLVGPRAKPKWVKFTCPCGCKETIALNLMASHSPRWSVTVEQIGIYCRRICSAIQR